MQQKEFLFVLGSARLDGNTEHLARRAAGSLPEHTGQTWLRLTEHQLPLFEDIRHHETRTYSVTSESERVLLEATLAATDVVIASPVYWYSVSAATKLYLDHWSGWMRLPDIEFKKRMASKTFWAISAYSDTDPAGAQPLIETIRMTAEYMDMKWGGVLLGYGNRPADVLDDAASMETCREIFQPGLRSRLIW